MPTNTVAQFMPTTMNIAKVVAQNASAPTTAPMATRSSTRSLTGIQ